MKKVFCMGLVVLGFLFGGTEIFSAGVLGGSILPSSGLHNGKDIDSPIDTLATDTNKPGFSAGNPLFETRGLAADDVDLHYHTTVFPTSVKKLKVRMILTDYVAHDYIYKTMSGAKNTLNDLCFKFTGAFAHATVSNIQVIENPSDGITEGEYNDHHNKSIFELTFTDIDMTQEIGSFTLKAGANCFGKEYTQTIYFEGVSIKNTTPANEMLDKDCGANPSYTLHFSVTNGTVANRIRPSDISFTGALSDCVVTSVEIDDDCKGFILKFKKTDLHYVSGASKEGNIVIAPGLFLYVGSNANGECTNESYSAKVNIEFIDPYIPPIEYDAKGSPDISFNQKTLTTRCLQTGPKIIGDVAKELMEGPHKAGLSALCKTSAFVGIGLDILFSLLQGSQNDLVMEQLQMMDQKLDVMSDNISGLYSAIQDSSTQVTAMDQLKRLDADTNTLMHNDESNRMRFERAVLAINELNSGKAISEEEQEQIADYLQGLFSTTKDGRTDMLAQFKQFAADISGSSTYTALAGHSIFEVYQNYATVKNDWEGRDQLSERKAFLEQVEQQYAVVSTYFLFAIGFDKELNESKMQTYQEWKQRLEAVDASKLTAEETRDVTHEKNICENAIRDLQISLNADNRLLSNGNDVSELDSVEKVSQTIYKEIEAEKKAIEAKSVVIERGNIYSNRLNKWVTSYLHCQWDLGLFFCYYDDSHLREASDLNAEIDKVKKQPGDVHNSSTLLTKSEIDLLSNSAKARKYSSLLAELLECGFTYPTQERKILFSGRCEKPYDSWGSLWNSGYCYADVYVYNENTFSESRHRCMQYDVGTWGGTSWSYTATPILFLQYGG